MIKPFSHYSIENIPTVYDEEAKTVLQLVAQLTGKINEIIKDYNAKDGTLTKMGETVRDIDKHLAGIAETLGEVIVEPLGFATPQMFGATGDGVADDTQAIKAAINALTDHCGVLYFPPGTYLVTEDIELKSNIAVTGSGASSIIKRASNALTHYRVFRAVNLSNVIIRDLSIMGDKATHEGADGEWGMCISLEGSRNVTIDRCSLHDGWGDGVYIGSQGEQGCEKIIIRDTMINGNRRNGISVINVDGLTVDGCQICNTTGTEPKAGIDFEPNNAQEGALNVKIINTTFHDNGKDVLFADTENNLYFNKYVTFTACVFRSQGGLDWRTPLNGAYNTGNPDCFVRFDGCQFINSYRGIRITKGDWDTPLTLTGCDFTCNGIAIEVGESSKDYGGKTLGGVSLLNCRVHKNGNNPVVRCVGSGASFAGITVDLHVNKTIKAYGYFSGTATDVHLDFHDGVFQVGVSTDFDKYKVPSTIYMASTAEEQGYVHILTESFPKGQVIRFINDSLADEVIIDYLDQEGYVPKGISYVTITPAGKLSIYGGK